MNKFNLISFFLIFLVITGCTMQEEAPPKEQEQKPIVENKIKEVPPKVSEPTGPITPNKTEEQHQAQPKFKRIEVELSRPIDGLSP